MGRKQQIRELQIAEAELASRRQQLQECTRQRIDYLRALGPPCSAATALAHRCRWDCACGRCCLLD